MKRLRVLLVGIGGGSMSVVCDALLHSGIEFRKVNDSDLALPLIKEYEPSIIIMDIKSPQIADNHLYKQVRSNPETQNIQFICLSADDNVKDVMTGVKLMVVDFIEKPIAIQTLLDHIMILDFSASITQELKGFETNVKLMCAKYNVDKTKSATYSKHSNNLLS